MIEAILFIGLTLFITTGSPYPVGTTPQIWLWLALSSVAGYVIGDYFFLRCFILIGARWGELFMTIAPVAAAITGWLLLGEAMSAHALLGMFITIIGIGMSVLARPDSQRHKLQIKLPIKGVIFGIIAGIGQGVGLVFSKQGMLLYQNGLTDSYGTLTTFDSLYMSFASTQIRCIVALAGFLLMYGYSHRSSLHVNRSTLIAPRSTLHATRSSLHAHRYFWLATLSAFVGPFIGVALSLAASLYTSTGITQTIMSLIPVLILWPSHLLFKTKITLVEIIGACISVCGVALFFI